PPPVVAVPPVEAVAARVVVVAVFFPHAPSTNASSATRTPNFLNISTPSRCLAPPPGAAAESISFPVELHPPPGGRRRGSGRSSLRRGDGSRRRRWGRGGNGPGRGRGGRRRSPPSPSPP